jgi:hypothetical protein
MNTNTVDSFSQSGLYTSIQERSYENTKNIGRARTPDTQNTPLESSRSIFDQEPDQFFVQKGMTTQNSTHSLLERNANSKERSPSFLKGNLNQ